MKTETWTQAARHQYELGRLLPLGGSEDGTWITEQAAVRALRGAVTGIPDARLDSVRIGAAPLEPVSEPAVRPPVGALPPGPLRMEAAFTASLGRPLPQTAEQVRSALLRAATEELGLAVVTADLSVTDLDEGPETIVRPPIARKAMRPQREATAGLSSPMTATGPTGTLAGVAAAVPGVARLTTVPGGRPITVKHEGDPPGLRIEVQIAVVPGHHPLEVARAVRAAVAEAAASATPGPVTAAVVITETALRPAGDKRQP
ncbi:hypothetical protein [Streptomyces sp. NPDC092370]|uniref:hypothetical protein n=1 Tax=Streptomyces sp. NPDC092370 TaxID=3366016 RepID=UPI0038267356